MAEGFSTDSYPKPPVLPVQKSMLDQAQQYQQMDQTNIAISQAKLKYYNDQYNIVNDDLTTFANDPKATPQEVVAKMHSRLQAMNASPEVRQQMESQFTNLSNVPLGKDGSGNPEFSRVLDQTVKKAQAINDRVNNMYKTPGMFNNQNSVQPTRTDIRGNINPQGDAIPLGVPTTTETQDTNETLPNGQVNPNYLKKGLVGSYPPPVPPGMVQKPGGFQGQGVPAPQSRLPVQGQPTQQPMPPPRPMLPVGKGNLTNDGQVTGMSVQNAPPPNQHVQNRFPAGITTAPAPGVAEAAGAAGQASGQVLASERTKAASFQRDIFPLAKAIPELEKLGTKGTGPGTETINNLKSFVLSNIPGVKESDFGLGSVKDFDQAKKYLTDFVNQTGNVGTNDKLAASFAGNPSVHISNAAAVDVAKSALALRRMQQSKYLAFEDSGQPADQASKFFANGDIKYQVPGKDEKGKDIMVDRSIKASQLDPRAFGVDNMSVKAKEVLFEQLSKNPREKELFDKSGEIALRHGYLAAK